MAQYIDKSAVVAEIKERIDRDNEMAASYPSNSEHDSFYRDREKVYKNFLSFINTLEVKEVDLEKELESWRHNHFHGRRDKEASGEYLERVSQLDFAKHFFELGLKAQKGEEV